MPPKRRRRAAQRISYVEHSSDEDDISSSEEYTSDRLASSSPVTRKRSRRITTRSSQSSESESHRPPKRQMQRTISYKEDTTDDEEFDVQVASDNEVEPCQRRRRTATKPRSPAKPNKRNARLMRAAPVLRKERESSFKPLYTPFARKQGSMYWDTLPFHILVSILDFATRPLNDPNSIMKGRFDSAPWLVHTSRVCKAWLEPAMNVLYHSPPFYSAGSIYLLSELLSKPVEDRPSANILARPINHNVKIRQLEIDASDVLAYAAHLRGKFDLAIIIPLLPHLDTVLLTNKFETPELRQRKIHVKWNYPDGLFAALNESGRKLKRFQWIQSMLGKHQDLAWMTAVHNTNSFQSIEEIKFCGFEEESRKKKKNSSQDQDASGTSTAEELLAQAIRALPNLKKLEFESSSILNEVLLPLLPQSLEVFVANDCHFFDSFMLSPFLASHGSQLKELELSHNKALEISFTTTLKFSCPRLEVLRMDLNHFNTYRTYKDSAPTYNNILDDNDIPQWPSTLREIEMLYLRHWTDSAAKSFFKSLVNSAESLPSLRLLRLKAILGGLDWRQRISFREEWVSRLQRVFLRKDRPPNPHFQSIADGRTWLDNQSGRWAHSMDNESNADAPLISHLSPKKSPPTRGSGRTLRPRRRGIGYSEDSSDDEKMSAAATNTSSALANAAKAAMEKHIQGLCSVVDVTIDNLRPAEKQFNEADFLDSAPEDDEWNGREEGELFESWAF